MAFREKRHFSDLHLTIIYEKKQDKFKDLQKLLNKWNLLRVPVPPDEYDCLINPLLSMLHRKSSKQEIIKFIEKEMRNHFGVELETKELEKFAESLINWYLDNSASP